MSWFKKLFTVGTNVVNEKMEEVTHSIVDIKREGNALIQKLDKDINTLHTRIVDAQKEIQLSKHEVNINKGSISTFNHVAKQAVNNGNDEDAINALSRVEGLEMIVKTHEDTINILQPIVDSQITHVNKLVSEKQLLKAEITRLDLEERQYKLRAKLVGDNSNVSTGGIDINYLRDRVNTARATCEAKEIVNSKVLKVDITDVQNNRVTTSTVEQRLADLKAKV